MKLSERVYSRGAKERGESARSSANEQQCSLKQELNLQKPSEFDAKRFV